jgi:hypothetical protein
MSERNGGARKNEKREGKKEGDLYEFGEKMLLIVIC